MARPNPALEAALAQFNAQPGTTPDQEAQLRAAITADAGRLTQLNQQATAGRLRGFALEAPGSTPSLVGAYDKASGVVTLPSSSFQAGSTTASSDLKAVLGVQALTVDFAQKTWQDAAGQTQTVSQDMVGNLQATLNGSPVLAGQIKDAVTQGHVQHFSLMGSSMSAGATYDGNTVRQDGTPKGINLPVAGLQSKTAANPQGKYDVKDMTFVLGHEIQHGFNDAQKDQRTEQFLSAVKQEAKVAGPVHDYTDELRDYIQASREDEAKANLAGWNALLSREQQANPTVKGLDLMFNTGNDRVWDFIDRDPTNPLKYTNKPNLAFNQDGSVALRADQVDATALQIATAQGKSAADVAQDNIKGMGENYFDRPSPNYAQLGQRPVHIGEHKPQATTDYPNLYGNWAVEQVIKAEAAANVTYQGAKPKLMIDMATTGLKEDLLEMEGLDLGASKPSITYYDSSQTPAAQRHFDHTQDGSVTPQQDHQYVPVTPSAPSVRTGRSPADEDHPDHGTLQRIRAGVGAIDQTVDKPWDQTSERLSRCLLAACKDDRERYGGRTDGDYSLAANALTQVDHVVMGKDGRFAFAVQGGLHDPLHKLAAVDVAQAIRTPVEVSDAKVDAANTQITQQLALTQQQELVRGPEDPNRGGPTR